MWSQGVTVLTVLGGMPARRPLAPAVVIAGKPCPCSCSPIPVLRRSRRAKLEQGHGRAPDSDHGGAEQLGPRGIAFDDAALDPSSRWTPQRGSRRSLTSSLVAGRLRLLGSDDWFIRLDGERFSASVRGTVEQASGVEAIKLAEA